MSKKYTKLNIIYISNLNGELYGRSVPDIKSRTGKGLINIHNLSTPISSNTSEKYLLKCGLPRIQTRIKQIIKQSTDNIMICTSGNSIGGSPEALFSQGQVLVKALNKLGTKNNKIDYNVPGKLDYIYGQRIFEYTFRNGSDSNNYCDNNGKYNVPNWLSLCIDKKLNHLNSTTLGCNIFREKIDGTRLPILLGYDIKEYKESNIKIGMIGLTTNDRPTINYHMLGIPGNEYNYQIDGHVNNNINKQKIIDDLLISTIRKLKYVDKCDAIVCISDFGLHGNIRIAELEQLSDTPIDCILSSGSYEKISMITKNNNTQIIELGSYGESIADIKLKFVHNENKKYLHHITNTILEVGPYVHEDCKMRKYIDNLMSTYYPTNSVLSYPDITVLNSSKNSDGNDNNSSCMKINRNDIFPTKAMSSNYSGIIIKGLYFGLHRYNFMKHSLFPAYLEGNSHNLMSECMRSYSKCQIGMIRGFQNNMSVESKNNISLMKNIENKKCKCITENGYGDGSLTLADLFSCIPFTSYIGRGFMKGNRIINVIKNNTFMSLHGNIYNWKDEYLYGWSGIKIEYDSDSMNKLISGLLTTPNDIILKSVKILKSCELDPFNIINYVEIDENKHYSIASHSNPDSPNRLNNILLDSESHTSIHNIKPSYLQNNDNDDKWINTILKDIDTNMYISCPIACYDYLKSLSSEECSKLLSNISIHNNIIIDNLNLSYNENILKSSNEL